VCGAADNEVFQAEEVVIRKETVQITGLLGNPSYAAELGLTNPPYADGATPAQGTINSLHMEQQIELKWR